MEDHNLINPREAIHQSLKPLSPEDLSAREEMESNPENYETQIYLPGIEKEKSTDLTEKFRSLQSGYVDFRNTAENPNGKNVVWIGDNHIHIAKNGAQFPDDLSLNDYIVGLKTNYDSQRRRFIILRDMVGQSCQRTEEHIQKIIDAAENALNRDLIQNDSEIQRQFAMKDYGLSDKSIKNIYMEGAENNEHSEHDTILLSPETEATFTDPDLIETLQNKIAKYLPMLTKNEGASIRIPYRLFSKIEEAEGPLNLEMTTDEFAEKLEKVNPKIICDNIRTRIAFQKGDLPGEAFGYLHISLKSE